MNSQAIRNVIILGSLAVAGLLSLQAYLLLNTWNENDREFERNVKISLLNVAQELADYNEVQLPRDGLIKRENFNYYAVNYNGVIDPGILEEILIDEFKSNSLLEGFQWAIHDCNSDEIVQGNYCSVDLDSEDYVRSDNLPAIADLDYYFSVLFPKQASHLITKMNPIIIFGLITLLAIIFLAYSMWVILRQRRLSVMQRDFINNMTHEFKTPIASIKLASDVLSSQANISEDSRLSQYVNIIRDQNTRLNKQVERVLNIAKLDRDDFQLKKESFNIREILLDIAATESVRLDQTHGGAIQTSIPDSISDIYADKIHFTNCMYSLIDNAIKYCKQIPNILINAQQKGKNIILQISDNGIGMNEDQIPKIFNKFYRVPTGNLHDVKGFGLGLFYVKNICNAHEWDIKVSSEIDSGTSITLNIPIK